MSRALLVGAILLLAGVAVWWFAQDGGTSPLSPPESGSSRAVDSTDTTAVSVDVVEAAAEAPVQREARSALEREAAPAPEEARPLSLLRGRCVDPEGNPLAGIVARFSGWGANSERVDEWRREHAEPERLSEDHTTGADGAFEFRFWPPPPFQFALRLQGAGRATWSGRWHELAIGENVDLGDVELPSGTLLRGRVVDANGGPVGKVEVRINSSAGRGGDNSFERWCTARTKADGTFESRWALLSGDYELGIDDHPIERPQSVTLSGDEQFVEVVLQRITAADVIAGVVVDESGAPVARAMIHAFGVHTGRINQTDREGRFRVLRPEKDAPDAVEISATHDSYSAVPSAVREQYAWGRDDVRIVLKQGGAVMVLAVRAADETPVEDYVLRIVPVGGGFFSSNDQRPRGGDHHAGGRESVTGIRPGTHQVIVEPRGADLATGTAPLEVTSAGTASVVVRLAATSPRTVRVQYADGAPVADTLVQLVDPLGQPLTAETPIRTTSQWGSTSATKAIELAAAKTDDAGDVVLPVPGDRPVGLALPGPSHAPLIVPNAVFPADGPLVVTVSRGAILRGTVGPAAALAEIRRLAGIDEELDARRQQWPTVYLTRNRSLSPNRFPDRRDRRSMEPDGTFELDGVPAGRWHLAVGCFQRAPNGSGGGWIEENGGEVVLIDGETTTVQLDFSRILPGELDGLVLHNGAPLADTAVSLQSRSDDPTGQSRSFNQQVTTDADGRFHVALRGGDYTLSRGVTQGTSWVTLRAVERGLVIAGQRAERTFHIESGDLKLRLLDSAGKPIAGAPVELRDSAGAHRVSTPATDAEGRTEVRCDAVPLTAWVLPRRLQDRDALMAFYQAHAGEPDPLASVRIPLGDVTPRAGETVELELRAPVAFDR